MSGITRFCVYIIRACLGSTSEFNTGRLHLKGVPFSGSRYIKGWGLLELEYLVLSKISQADPSNSRFIQLF